MLFSSTEIARSNGPLQRRIRAGAIVLAVLAIAGLATFAVASLTREASTPGASGLAPVTSVASSSGETGQVAGECSCTDDQAALLAWMDSRAPAVEAGVLGERVIATATRPSVAAVGADEAIWSLAGTTLSRLDTLTGKVASIHLDVAGGAPQQVAVGSHGEVWVVSDAALLRVDVEGAPTSTAWPAGLSGREIDDAAASEDGGLWLVTSDGTLLRLHDGSLGVVGAIGEHGLFSFFDVSSESVTVGSPGDVARTWHASADGQVLPLTLPSDRATVLPGPRATWLTDDGTHALLAYAPDSGDWGEWVIPAELGTLRILASAPDGSVWLTGSDAIVRFIPSEPRFETYDVGPGAVALASASTVYWWQGGEWSAATPPAQ